MVVAAAVIGYIGLVGLGLEFGRRLAIMRGRK